MKVVRIFSKINVFVYGTDYTQGVGDSKSNYQNNPSTWINTKRLIKEGTFYYPAEIRNWTSVQSLEKAGQIILTDVKEGAPDDPETTKAVEATKLANDLEKEEKAKNARVKLRKQKLEEATDKAILKSLEE